MVTVSFTVNFLSAVFDLHLGQNQSLPQHYKCNDEDQAGWLRTYFKAGLDYYAMSCDQCQTVRDGMWYWALPVPTIFNDYGGFKVTTASNS